MFEEGLQPLTLKDQGTLYVVYKKRCHLKWYKDQRLGLISSYCMVSYNEQHFLIARWILSRKMSPERRRPSLITRILPPTLRRRFFSVDLKMVACGLLVSKQHQQKEKAIVTGTLWLNIRITVTRKKQCFV